MARPPKPIAELKARGTYRKDRHERPVLSPELLQNVPDCPDHLPESCRADWFRICGLLAGLGILTNADLDSVGRYVLLLQMQRQATAELSTGPTVKTTTRHGEVHKQHPAFKVLLECSRELRAIGEKLGFDPLSRQRINLTNPPEAKDHDSFKRNLARLENPSPLDFMAGGIMAAGSPWLRIKKLMDKEKSAGLTPEEDREFRDLRQSMGEDPLAFLFEN